MDTSASGASPPAGPEETGIPTLRLIALALRAILAVCLVLWFVPDAAGLIGLADVLRPIARHRALWIALLPVLLVLFGLAHLLAGARVRDRRSALRERQALELSGEVVERRTLGPGGQWVQGPDLRLPVGRHAMTVSTVVTGSRGGRTSDTRAVVVLETADLFGFQAIGAGHPVRMFGGFARAGFARGLKLALRRAKSDAERRSVESVAYLSGPPVRPLPGDVADLLELRSNDPSRAVALLGAPGVAGGLRALCRLTTKWEWTLYPAQHPRRAELTVTLPGGSADTEVLRAVQALHEAVVEALDQSKAA